jgi:NAD(P)-dependent dehydrogenase (short-subunit alcohol dehydrogenase family)
VTDLRFDGRVAVVTGAGRGIGRAYARLLAERGASVVVNDLGGSMDGTGVDTAPAAQVVDEITSSGGSAVADTSDISTATGAGTVVDTAVAAYGRIDIVINNAGIIRWAGPPAVDEANLAAHLAVHTVGSFNLVRAAWPHLTDQAYGRIVNTTSSGIFGLPKNTSYATAKAAVIGLTRSLAVAGARHGIKANLIAPVAVTRMSGGAGDATAMAPEMVAPMAAFLAHEDCPVTGEMYAAGAGRFARIFIATTPGYIHDGRVVTVEDVAGHWAGINDERGYTVPDDLMTWSASFLDHLDGG